MNMRFQLYSLACLLMTVFGSVTAQTACFTTTGDTAGFSLSVETFATDVVDGQTTYRVYLSTPSSADFLSAAIGDSDTPLFLNSTTSFYQDALGGTTAGSVNPLLYDVPGFESVQYDSWVTVGIQEQPDMNAGQTDVAVLVDPNIESWEVPFTSGGNIDISSPIGGGWYILPSSTNGIAGDDNRILIAQLTTDGEISGQFFLQIFPGGVQTELIESSFSFSQTACATEGCTDQAACNYDSSADQDNGTCTFAAANFDCDGNCLTTPTEFNVDMSCTEETFSTVHVTGPWCGWCGAEDYNTLSDTDGDGTYSVSVCIPAGDVEYKFMIDNWASQENLADDMADGGTCAPVTDFSSYANRVTTSGSTTSDTYGSCLTCAEQLALQTVTVSFAIDMSSSDYPNADYDNVVINGSWNGWNGWGVPLSDDDQDNVFTGTLDLDVNYGDFEFVVAVTGPADGYGGWGQTINAPTGGACSVGSPANYILTVGADDLSFAACAGLCDATCPTGTPGCVDQGANNYSADATYDDGTCLYSMSFSLDLSQTDMAAQPHISGQFNGWNGTSNPMTDDNLDGVWEVTVEMLSGAQEYKFTANDWAMSESFDGSESCTTAPGEYVNRVITVSASASLPTVCWNSCSECPQEGCTTESACNYTSLAGYDDGSCYFCCADLNSNVAGYGLEQEIVAWDGIPGMRTYRFYITTPNTDDVVSAVSGDSDVPTLLNTTTSFYQDPLGSAFPNGINPATYDAFPTVQYDSWVTIGIDQAPDLAANEAAVSFAEAESWITEFEAGQNLAIDGFFGGAWFSTANNANGLAGDDKKVLLAQLTTDGDLSGQFFVQVLPNGAADGLGELVTLSFGPYVDSEAPSFVDFPADVTVGCDDPLPTADVQASDACSDWAVTMEETTSGDACLTTVVRTYTATDGAGNSTSTSWTISVVDDAAPSFDGPADFTANCGDDLSPASTGEVSNASDCSSFDVTYNDVDMFNTDPCIGQMIARTWRATDECGNEAIDIQIITVLDAAAPSIVSVPADTIISCDAAVPASEIQATDDCGSVTTSQSDAITDGECTGGSTILRTFVAVDPCGNSTEYVQTISVVDTVAPVFTSVPADLTVSVYDDLPSEEALATDNCSSATVLSFDQTDGSANDYAVVTRTFTAVDACGNSSTATQTITVLELLGCTDALACNYNDAATADDGSCDFCSCNGVYPATGPYNLEVETVEGGIDGQTTYQVYVTLQNATDFVSALTGDSEHPSFVRSSTSFYQNPLGSANAHGINPLLYSSFPDLQYDSWVTIGLTGAADLAQGEGEVTLVEGESWVASFENGNDIELGGEFGGGWFSLNGSANGQAGDDLRVLVGQFTTDGVFSGQLYVQVFPEGEGDNMVFQTMRWGEPQCGCQLEEACNYDATTAYTDNENCLFPADFYGASHFDCDGVCLNDSDEDGVCDEDEIPGCTDEAGCNYSTLATDDDGSCSYPDYGYLCDGSCISDEDFDGICDLNEVQGCNLDNACNFNPAATENDGSCTFDCYGCTSESAANYDADALLDDGSCLFGGCTDNGASNYSADADFNNGSCIYLGCTNPIACNYTVGANQDDGSCDLVSCGGCTNEIACNYDADALLNDGSCEFFSCRGCTDLSAFNYADDSTVTVDDGSCIYGGCNDDSAANYDGTVDFNDGSCEYQGCTDNTACNFDLNANVSDGSCEFTSCAGCMITFACNYDPEATLQDDSQCDFYACCGDPAADNYEVGVADFLTYGCIYGGSAPSVQLTGCDLSFACNYGDPDNDCEYNSCSGCTEPGACNYDADATIPVTCLYPEDIYGTDTVDCDGNCNNDVNENGQCDENEVSGCTDPLACNYSDDATLDDGSCDTVSCSGCTDASACNYDASASVNDGSCDYAACFGCTDSAACNYDATASNDDGGCAYPASSFVDCNGDCLNDGNSNGICDEQETLGCTDVNACNFDSEATFSDGNCEYTTCTGCTTSSACNYDATAAINDGSCEFTSCTGCTTSTACNYDADATSDDGSCTYPEPEYDCDGNCLVDSDGDGICDAFDGNYDGCMDALACNYDAFADSDDGSCDFCSCSGFTSDLPGYGVEIEEYATNGVPGYTTYRVYITTPNPTDQVSAVTGVTSNPLFLETTGDFYQHPNGGVFPNGINPVLFDFFAGIEFDSWVTIGIDGPPSSADGEGNVQGLPEPEPWSSVFESGNGFMIDDVIGSGWFVNPDVTNGIAGDDSKVLLAQLTTNGELTGEFYVQVFPEGDNISQERVTLTFGGSQCGCTDITACNFSPSAVIDDESCYYPQFGYACGDLCLFDDEAPQFTEIPEDTDVSCSSDITVVMPAATDNCDQNLTFSYTDEITDGPCGETYDILRSYIVTDDFGLSDTVSHVIHVVDDQAPVFTNVPADGTIECGEDLPNAQPIAVDNCNGVTITHSDEMVTESCGETGTLVRTWSAEDACGNVSTATTTYTIEDNQSPEITDMPADTTLSCSDDYSFPMPASSDACSEVELTEEVSFQDGACANSYTMIRTFTAIDACGNFSQSVQAVTFVDNTAPTFAGVPADLTLECGDALPDHEVSATDDCEGSVAVSISDVENTLSACAYEVVRTFTATDACGNSSSDQWTITYEDTTAPTFTAPSDVTLDCSADTTPEGSGDVTDASDACDASPVVTHSDVISSGQYSLDGMTADIRVELRLNNLSSFPRVLEVIGATIGAGAELDLDDEVSNPFNLRGAVGVDMSGSSIDLSILDVVGSESYDFIEVRISNLTGAGIVGASLDVQNLFVDNDAVEFSQSTTDQEVIFSWSEVVGAMLSIQEGGTASATVLNADNCLANNVITRTWTVTDACGNSTSSDQVITLQDLTPPSFDFTPADQDLDCSAEYAFEMATATDACSDVEVTFSDSESFPCEGSRVIERTFTATDVCGNISTHVQTISFNDTTSPVFTSTPEDLVLECGDELPVTSAEVEDNCGTPLLSHSDSTIQGSCIGEYTVERTFLAQDGCGNESTYVQTISYSDNTAPEVTMMPSDTTYVIVQGASIPVEWPEASDVCSEVSMTFLDVCSEQSFGGYSAARTFTLTDDCGNLTEVIQQIEVLYILGCNDPEAVNFDPEALGGDGTCLYEGCTNEEAFNYNPLADIDDGSCLVADVEGCTDASACNFLAVANIEDGSCDYCSCLSAPEINGYSLELEPVAVDGVPGMTTYRMYVTMVNPTDVLSSVVGETGLETYINTSTSFYQDPFGGALGQSINPVLYGISPQLEYDSWVTIGLDQAPNQSAGEIEVTAVESQDANWISPFEAGGNLTIDGDFGGVWFTLNGATNAVAGDDLRVLLGQFTTGGSISGQISLQVFPEGNGDQDLIMTFPIGNSSCGCTDVEACNYSDLATNDDGSCSYPGVLDCDGETCVNDSDQDGICDELEVPGCDDVTAINYQDAASDNDGSCLYLGCMDSNADNYDAGANVEGDCTYPAEGCTDSEAANYDDSALIDDSSCLYVGCMDSEADNYDSAANVEGFCEYPAEGCTDSEAANFSDSALIDDGSCLYPGCTDSTALNYDPDANFDSGCILPMEGCTDPMAENYNALANTNDGTCEYTPPCPGDLNGDGTININDLLDFFQIYGQDCPE